MALKVLTVDDSKTIRTIVKKAFRPYDCEMIEAENGVEGLAAANREKPDLIVLDITMPVMNGIEMLEKLKGDAVMKNIPVIMLTAESGKDNVMQIVKMGVKDYMVKPFKGEQLIERAQNLVKLESKKEEKPPAEKPARLFLSNGTALRLFLPQSITGEIIAEISGSLRSQIENMPGSGMTTFIFDLSAVKKASISLIKLIISASSGCEKLNLAFRAVGSSAIKTELKQFQETVDIPVYLTVNEAQAA